MKMQCPTYGEYAQFELEQEIKNGNIDTEAAFRCFMSLMRKKEEREGR